MSDNPEGPGWWIASDGKWYPPELHPSVRTDDPVPEAVAVPETVTAEASPAPQRWHSPGAPQSHDEEAPRVGPQFPDLFQKALQGSHLADNVTFSGDNPRSSFDTGSKGRSSLSSGATGGSGSNSGTVGSFSGATATKRRWRRAH